jgi:hypothetical protein
VLTILLVQAQALIIQAAQKKLTLMKPSIKQLQQQRQLVLNQIVIQGMTLFSGMTDKWQILSIV